MNVPAFIKQKFTDEDGNLTAPVQQMLDVFFQQAQENLSNDGVVMPSLTTTTINNIASPSNPNSKPNGTIWYDSDTNQLKTKVNGLVKVINTV